MIQVVAYARFTLYGTHGEAHTDVLGKEGDIPR
jgi:hypothetical protein